MGKVWRLAALAEKARAAFAVGAGCHNHGVGLERAWEGRRRSA